MQFINFPLEMVENQINVNINGGVEALIENDDKTENEPLAQNPEILVKQEMKKMSEKMGELRTSLRTLRKKRFLEAKLEQT